MRAEYLTTQRVPIVADSCLRWLFSKKLTPMSRPLREHYHTSHRRRKLYWTNRIGSTNVFIASQQPVYYIFELAKLPRTHTR